MYLWIPDPGAKILHTIEFSLRLKPKAWTRVQPFLKGGKLIKVKPKGDRDWQSYFREEWIKAMQAQGHAHLFPWAGPVILQNYFLYQTPSDWWPGKEKTSIPDDDNLAKQVADALSPKAKGGYGAYEDDRQIIARSTAKFYHPQGDAVIVRLYLLEKVEKPKRARGDKTTPKA